MLIESEVEVRRKRQMTWPDEIAAAMEVVEGTHLIIEYDSGQLTATVRKRPSSYAGLLKGVYGDTSEDVAAYVENERSSWQGP